MAWPLRKLSTHTDNINEVVIRSSAKLSMISTYNFVIHILHSHNPIDPRGKTLKNGCLLLSYFIYLSSYQLYTFNLKIDYCNSYWKSFGIFFEIETDKNPTKFVWLLAINDDISFVTRKMRLVTLIFLQRKYVIQKAIFRHCGSQQGEIMGASHTGLEPSGPATWQLVKIYRSLINDSV